MKSAPNTLKNLADEALMHAYALGDAEAFAVLYERHHRKVYGYVRGRFGATTEAHDIFQECFLKVHRFRSTYDRAFPFLPWLFTICRNVIVDHMRKKARLNEERLDAAREPQVEPGIEPQPLTEALEGLAPKEAHVLRLHYVEGFSFNEVARHLKIEPAGARKISSRAVQKLRSFFKS